MQVSSLCPVTHVRCLGLLVIFTGLTGRSAVSVNPTVTVLNLLSLSTSLSLLQEQNTPSTLPAGMAETISHLSRMVKPRGRDDGTQTGEGKEDKTTQNEVGITGGNSKISSVYVPVEEDFYLGLFPLL